MPEVKATIETIKNKKQRQEVAELLAERAKYTRLKKEAEEMERACTQAIIPLLQKHEIKTIQALDDQGVMKEFVVIESSNTTIKKELLLNAGVDPDTITACTVRTPYTTLQVRTVKSEG